MSIQKTERKTTFNCLALSIVSFLSFLLITFNCRYHLTALPSASRHYLLKPDLSTPAIGIFAAAWHKKFAFFENWDVRKKAISNQKRISKKEIHFLKRDFLKSFCGFSETKYTDQ